MSEQYVFDVILSRIAGWRDKGDISLKGAYERLTFTLFDVQVLQAFGTLPNDFVLRKNVHVTEECRARTILKEAIEALEAKDLRWIYSDNAVTLFKAMMAKNGVLNAGA